MIRIFVGTIILILVEEILQIDLFALRRDQLIKIYFPYVAPSTVRKHFVSEPVLTTFDSTFLYYWQLLLQLSLIHFLPLVSVDLFFSSIQFVFLFIFLFLLFTFVIFIIPHLLLKLQKFWFALYIETKLKDIWRFSAILKRSKKVYQVMFLYSESVFNILYIKIKQKC